MTTRRASGLLLIRGDGAFLLQHRDKHARRFPNHWGFFGGEIGDAESPEDAMLREVKEELSIDVVEYRLVLQYYFSDAHDAVGENWIFFAPAERQAPLKLCEGQGMDWFTVRDLERLRIIPYDKEAIEKIIASLNFRT